MWKKNELHVHIQMNAFTVSDRKTFHAFVDTEGDYPLFHPKKVRNSTIYLGYVLL